MSKRENNATPAESNTNILGASKAEKTVSIALIVVSVILIPILIFNCILLLKSAINPDKIPSIGKYTPLIVLTESMELEILDGDLIITKITDTEDIESGDVISYFDPESANDSVVTHRVIEIIDENGHICFKTQGDNNDIEDRFAVPEENVIGVWTGFKVHGLGNVILFMQSTVGLILCVAIPVLAYVAYELIRRKRTDKSKQNDIDALKAELEALKAKKAAEENEAKSSAEGENTDELKSEADFSEKESENKPKEE